MLVRRFYLAVAVDGGVVQRRVVVQPPGVHVRPRPQQQLRHPQPAVVARLVQRRPSCAHNTIHLVLLSISKKYKREVIPTYYTCNAHTTSLRSTALTTHTT